MGTKRKLSEIESVHPSRQAQVPGASKPRKKSRRLGPQLPKKPENLTSVNAIKKRIRDVKRRLERSENLPADIRVENERALAAYQQDLVAAEEEKTKQKMIAKYHMVRFFERQKASRQVKKLRKRLLEAKSSEEVEDIKAQLHIAEVDLNYAQYYPLNMRYVSLYPQKNQIAPKDTPHHEDAGAPVTKPPMWAEVEKCMADGTLESLREGRKIKVEVKQKPPKTQRQQSKTAPLQSSKTSQKLSSRSGKQANSHTNNEPASQEASVNDDADDESDGGFFEE